MKSYILFMIFLANFYFVKANNIFFKNFLSATVSFKDTIPKNAVRGDFNGDGIKEYAWVVKPALTKDEQDCIGKCRTYIKFSNKKIISIELDNAIGGELTNLGDLNDNGKDEIGLLPDWFTSCWRNYHVYTYKKNTWMHAVAPFAVHCNEAESGVKFIEKDKARKGYVIIRYSAFVGDSDIVTKRKSERIK